MKKRNRVLASLLVIMMLVTILPTTAYASLLPLTERRFNVDYTEKLPDELKAVPVKEIFAGSGYSLKDTDMVSWSTANYGTSDDFTIIDANGTVDLRPTYSYYSSVTLTMIVGTADQLDPNNIRYIVTVNITSLSDLLEFDAATENRQKIEVYNHNNYYSYVRYTDESQTYYYNVSVDSTNYQYGDSAYVSMKLGETWQNAGLTATVYDGYYNSVDELPASDITSTVWAQNDLTAGGGFLGTYRSTNITNGQSFTLVLKRGETIVQALPFCLYLYPGSISISSSGPYTKSEYSWNHIGNGYNWDYSNEVETEVISLDAGYPANGTYSIYMTLSHPAIEYIENNGIAYVKAAYVGKYDTEEAAVGQTDIKAQLFSSVYNDGGYAADYSNGVTFTVFDTEGGVHHLAVKTVAGEATASSSTSFSVYSVRPANGEEYTSSYKSWIVPSDDDSYYGNGFQTMFLMNYDGTSVTDGTIIPYFSSSANSNVYAGAGGASGTLQESNKSEITFQSGEAVPYTVAAENGENVRNYWVTFITQYQGGAKLFVNGTNVESLKDNGMPVREIFMTNDLDGDYHDILIANIGDQALTGLNVTLENAQNIKLDDYWTISDNGVKQLAALDSDAISNSSYASNVGKIRLLRDGNGMISGTLKISSDNGGSVSIKLTGMAGTPEIITTSVVDGVKWVPYSSIIQTNYMYGSSDISFELNTLTLTQAQQESGLKAGLPSGVVLKPSGEVYGNPQEVGQFRFRVTATMSVRSALRGDLSWTSTATYTLTILENTNENVWNATDVNYEITTAIPNDDGTLTIDAMNPGGNSWSNETMLMVSQGEHDYFIDLWLDGVRLVEGVDYEHESGSTRITIRTQTLQNQGIGTHSLAIESREGDKELGTLKRAAQNYTNTGAISGVKPSTGTGTGTGTGGTGVYTVKSGDSLWSIAKQLLGSGSKWGLIYEANKDTIKDHRMIYVGQKLTIPGLVTDQQNPPSTTVREYTVVAGDSLWKIADNLLGSGAKWGLIYEANKSTINDPRKIFVGQKLIIPAT